jgi:hypothetical protein
MERSMLPLAPMRQVTAPFGEAKVISFAETPRRSPATATVAGFVSVAIATADLARSGAGATGAEGAAPPTPAPAICGAALFCIAAASGARSVAEDASSVPLFASDAGGALGAAAD